MQTGVVNMAADGMVLTNHDHQTRVGILTGKDTPFETEYVRTPRTRAVFLVGVTIRAVSPHCSASPLAAMLAGWSELPSLTARTDVGYLF